MAARVTHFLPFRHVVTVGRDIGRESYPGAGIHARPQPGTGLVMRLIVAQASRRDVLAGKRQDPSR
jgi:hypothetical protein